MISLSQLDSLCSSVQVISCSRPSNDCPWCLGNEYRHSNSDLCLHREILDFTRWILPTSEEKQLIHIILVRIQTAVSLIWPDARVVFIGSTLSNTIMPGDAIQFTILNTPEDDHPLEEKLDFLNKHLTSIQILRKSQIVGPTIQGIEKPFAFHVHISFNNIEGIIRGEREKSIIQMYPSSLPILMLMKFFIFQCRIEEKFTHDLVFQMVLFIIQSTPRQQQMNLGYLCTQFFNIFGRSFNYIVTGISTRNGGCLFNRLKLIAPESNEVDITNDNDNKSETEENNDLDNLKYKWFGTINWSSPQAICTEDTLHPGTFIGKDIADISIFRERCYKSYKQLKSEKDFRHGSDVYDQSLLLCFLSRPDFTMRQRTEKMKQYQVLVFNPVESFDLANDNSTQGNRQSRQSYQRRDNSNNWNYRDNRDGNKGRDGRDNRDSRDKEQYRDRSYRSNKSDNSNYKHHHSDDSSHYKGKGKNYRQDRRDDDRKKPYKR